ncbi:hypothetical protein Ciccas_011414 [Cichlidogyrus casuarinus]|uniref:Uncharacterized protein n=1 Tax=Cichlidogyrus casuarinus TaxID=1844966 RepID=A0ABD2PSZ6_9PLAT
MRLRPIYLIVVLVIAFTLAQDASENRSRAIVSEDKCRTEDIKCERGEECVDGECRCISQCHADWQSGNRVVSPQLIV